MRILWICGSRVVGGAEHVTIQLGQLLAKRGHSIEVLCPNRTALDAALAEAGLPAHHGPIGSSLDIRAFFAIRRALRGFSPDLALVTTAPEWVWASLARDRRQRTRMVFIRYMALPLPRAVRWLANRAADAIITNTEAARRSVLIQGVVRPELVHVIHHLVRFAPRAKPPDEEDRARARASLGLPQGGRWVGFFGGLNERKGIGDVIWAVRRASAQVGEIHLLVCGRRGDKNVRPAEDWDRTLGLPGRFHCLGEIPNVQEAMTAVDAVMVATHSSLNEGSSAALHEAMACGTPVIAYATGGMPETIGPGDEAGLLCRPDDPDSLATRLAELFTNPQLAQRLATAGLARVRERHTPEALMDRYETLFSRLAG